MNIMAINIYKYIYTEESTIEDVITIVSEYFLMKLLLKRTSM